MPQTCRACRSPRAAEIALALDVGTPLRDIARQVSLDWHVIERHKKNRHHVTPALVAAIAEREKLTAESHAEALDRIAREQRLRAEKLDGQNDPGGASKVAAREADIHVTLGQLTAPADAPVVKISFSFAGSAWRPNASGEVATMPAGELQAPVAGIELQVPAPAIAEIVAPSESEEPSPFAAPLDVTLRTFDEPEERPRSALIEPDPEPRRGGF